MVNVGDYIRRSSQPSPRLGGTEEERYVGNLKIASGITGGPGDLKNGSRKSHDLCRSQEAPVGTRCGADQGRLEGGANQII